jgi:LemA protein
VLQRRLGRAITSIPGGSAPGSRRLAPRRWRCHAAGAARCFRRSWRAVAAAAAEEVAMSFGFLATVGVLAALALIAVTIYNRLTTLRNRARNAFAQIDVQLKRRYDLIPNLVDVAKGYLQHERETLEAVMRARSAAMHAEAKAAVDPTRPGAMASLAGAEGALGGALSRLLMTVEAYPELKADKAMADLSEELRSTENRVAFARQGYNDAVTLYNTERQKFPAVALAGALGFQDGELFELVDPIEREAPRTSFAR